MGIVRQGRRLLCRRGPEGPSNALQRITDNGRVRGRVQPGRLVRLLDGVQAALDTARLQVPGAFGDIGRYSIRRSR